jgi:hypothetical protein
MKAQNHGTPILTNSITKEQLYTGGTCNNEEEKKAMYIIHTFETKVKGEIEEFLVELTYKLH